MYSIQLQVLLDFVIGVIVMDEMILNQIRASCERLRIKEYNPTNGELIQLELKLQQYLCDIVFDLLVKSHLMK